MPKTIGNFFGYATTVFDFTRRAMPFNMPRSLTNDEVYALTAYILSLNKIIGENDVMDAKTLPAVKMPNRDNFIIRIRTDLIRMPAHPSPLEGERHATAAPQSAITAMNPSNTAARCCGTSMRAASRPSRSTGPRSTTPITAS